MSVKKTISMLAASMLVAYSSAYAGCIEAPVSLGVSVGIIGVLNDNDFNYTILPGPTTVVGTITTSYAITSGTSVPSDMNNDGMNGMFGITLGYTNTEIGAGINLEVSFNTLDLNGSGSFTQDTFSSDMLGVFLNIDWRTLASAAHNADSNIGGYFSLGVGFVDFMDVDGVVNFTAIQTAVNSTGPVTTITPLTGVVVYNDFDELVFAGKVKLGVEGLIGRSATFGVNIGLIGTAEADNLTSGTTVVSVKDPTGAVVTNAVLQDVAVNIPSLWIGFLEAKISYFFGGNM